MMFIAFEDFLRILMFLEIKCFMFQITDLIWLKDNFGYVAPRQMIERKPKARIFDRCNFCFFILEDHGEWVF